MFGLFKNKSSVRVTDKVWISQKAKWAACEAMLKLSSNVLFIGWFEDTLSDLNNHLNSASTLLLSRDATPENTNGHMVIFIEHYPIAKNETELFEKLGLMEVNIMSSLDEPFFEKFAGDRTIEVMRRLGMDENEAIGNSMVHRSIRNAQDAIAKRVDTERPAKSQGEWMNNNLGKI